MNVGVIGVGGVGGYFGGKICRAASSHQANVFFVARGAHLAAIRDKGLTLSTADEGNMVCSPLLATDNIDDLPTLDVCLLCVKSYDLHNVLLRLRHRLSPATLVVPLLNGVDVYERVREVIDSGVVFPACVYVGTHIEAYGKVTQKGGACKILLGPDPNNSAVVPDALFGLLGASSVNHAWFDDVYPEIWTKYIFIVSFALVTAAFDKTIGQIMESADLSRYARSVMEEVVSLARAKGVALSDAIVETTYRKGNDFPSETKTSFQRDVEQADKPDERDLFGGTVIRMGAASGIATPATQELYKRLEARKPLAAQP
jgi:2-dehydropantoate 2-reductase